MLASRVTGHGVRPHVLARAFPFVVPEPPMPSSRSPFIRLSAFSGAVSRESLLHPGYTSIDEAPTPEQFAELDRKCDGQCEAIDN